MDRDAIQWYCFMLHAKDWSSKDVWNIDILPHHYTASQPKRLRLHWNVAVKVNLFSCIQKEMGLEGVDCLAQDGDRWCDAVNTVMNLRIP
jgi:hypothetical protein